MVIPTCFVHIPALPSTVISSGTPVGAALAYASTNTNYFGATSCGLSSHILPTPSTWMQPPLSTVKCASLPASISGMAYHVTPVVYVTVTISSTILTPSPVTCNSIAPTNINKGNFQLACKTLRGKDLGLGFLTISWRLPAAASVRISANTLFAMRPSSKTTYVVNPARATTTLIPKTITNVYLKTSRTTTRHSTSIVRVTSGTSTCYVTTTVTAVPVSGSRRRRSGGAYVPRDPELLPASDSAVADADAGHDPANDNGNNDGGGMELKERAAATPTIGKPDFVYPPYGVTTVYVKSYITTTNTYYDISWSVVTGPPVTTTYSYKSYTVSTVTVTVTPAAAA